MWGSSSGKSGGRAKPALSPARFPLTFMQSSNRVLLNVTLPLTCVVFCLFLKANKSHLWPKQTFNRSGLFSGIIYLNHFFSPLSLSLYQVVISTRPPWRTSWRAMQWFTEVWVKAALFCAQSSTILSGCEVRIQHVNVSYLAHQHIVVAL